MSGVLPIFYRLSIYNCIENNGTSLLEEQVEPKKLKHCVMQPKI